MDTTRQGMQQVAQKSSRPWAVGKSFDKSAPCGPLYAVEKNSHAETGRIWLSGNDEIEHDSDLSLQRWPVAEGISILSRSYELAARAIIVSGTPAGIGPVIEGDVIKCGIDGLGEIEVRIT